MISLKRRAHQEVFRYLRSGDVAVDLTAGNGLDTVFLASLVAPMGRVHAFDIQESAIEATRQRVRQSGWESQVVLHHQSHASWSKLLSDNERRCLRVVMMNLGYQPGGDLSVVTQPDTTMQAIAEALDSLVPGGLLSIIAYTGHPGGYQESQAVRQRLKQLSVDDYAFEQVPIEPAPNTPVLYLATKH